MAGIFISYRREDSGAYSGRLYDFLIRHFDPQHVFFDIEAIGLGEDFRKVIQQTLSSCKVVLVVIGKQWATARDKNGKLRLDNETDHLRLEVASALQKGLRVIPVLVGGAEMPEESGLPPDIRDLMFRNALDVSDKRFYHDAQLLVDAIKTVLANAGPTPNIPAPSKETPERATSAKIRKPKFSSSEPSLFPVFGIILGETTVSEVELSGVGVRSTTVDQETGKPDFNCEVGGFLFGYDETSEIVDSMHLVHGFQLPDAWVALGFEWEKNYDEWLSWLKSLGYSLEIDKPPRVEKWHGHDSFAASLYARKRKGCPHRIWLTFAASEGTTSQSPNTVLSLYITPL